MSDEKDAEIIELPKREGVEPKLRVVRASYCICSLTIDEKERAVHCKRCGKLWDPVQALLFLARNWTTYASNRDALRAEVKRLEERRERLRKDIQNAKAQTKRLGVRS